MLEDEYLLNSNIKEFLEIKGLLVEAYTDGEQLLQNSSLKADLALLDIEVPGANGYEIIEWIKGLNPNLPVIFMTAYTDIDSIEKAYSLGCIDYLKKPFDLKELWIKIELLLHTQQTLKITLDEHTIFDMQEEQLYYKDEIKKLTKIQRKILKILIEHKNIIVNYEMLLSEVWEDNFIKVNTIASHVKEIRKYIPHNMIESIRAEGYRLHL
jgi:DNA-binding response OmpR family regulator